MTQYFMTQYTKDLTLATELTWKFFNSHPSQEVF